MAMAHAPPHPSPARTAADRRVRAALTCLAVAAAAALFAATARWPESPDGLIHLQRVRALAEALRAGVLFPRWFPDFAFGYGSPVLNFYAPAFYYPPALLHLAGMEIIPAVRLTLALCFGLSLMAMGALARLWTGAAAALLAAALYAAGSYRLYDLFVRGALPEFAAFLWLPLIALTSVRLGRAAHLPRAVWGPRLAACALAWAALLLTHNLTALMAAVGALVAGGTLLVGGALSGQGRVLGRALLLAAAAALLGLLLSAWYSVPALVEARWVGVGGPAAHGYTNHFAPLGAAVAWRLPYPYPTAAEPVVPLPLSAALAGAAGVALLLGPRGGRERRLVAAAALAVLPAAAWLTTESSAWLWNALAPLLSRLQFPWRWQTLTLPAAALLLALAFDALPLRRAPVRGGLAALLALAAALGATAGLRWTAVDFDSAAITRAQMNEWDSRFGQVGMTWTGEFLPVWVSEQRWAIGREPTVPPPDALPPATFRAHTLASGYLGAEYRVDVRAPGPVRFQTFFYPAWRVLLDGAPLPTRPAGDLGLLEADLPPGTHTLALAWGATPAVWAGRALTAVGWLAVLALLAAGARHGWLAAWLGAGALALLAATGITARAPLAFSAQADFGPVLLTGIVAPPARAGEQATLMLHWLVLEQTGDLTAFVHLLDDAGRIVAQHDGPLATPYTPAARRLPGQLLDVPVTLLLPAGLEPRRDYALRIGLYPPDRPDAPLQPALHDTPYVQARALEVRP